MFGIKFRMIVIGATVAVLTVPSLVSAQERTKDRVAVLEFENLSGKRVEDIGKAASEKVLDIFVKLGRFVPIERSQLERILEEQLLGTTGIVDIETAITMGKIKGVDYVVLGSITAMSEGSYYDKEGNYHAYGDATVALRVIKTATGEVCYSGTKSGSVSHKSAHDAVMVAIGYFRSSLYTAFPIKGYVIEILETEKQGGRQVAKTVSIDMGTEVGIVDRTKILVIRVGPSKKHPVTGEMIPGREEVIAELLVKEAHKYDSIAEVKKIRKKGYDVKIGDPCISAEIKKKMGIPDPFFWLP